MSTNAVIRLEGYDFIELYKHWDGYPDATLAWLEDFNERFVANRGNDLPYKFAQLIRSSAFRAEQFDLDASSFTGWGVDKKGSNGYDYLYILKLDGTVSVSDRSKDRYLD
jgi:hypothetical protein